MKILGAFVLFLLTLFFIGINTSKLHTRVRSSSGSGSYGLGLYKHTSHLKERVKLYTTKKPKTKKKLNDTEETYDVYVARRRREIKERGAIIVCFN